MPGFRTKCFVFCLISTLLANGTVRAAIAISEAEFAAGVLVVRGHVTTPAREIQLDGLYGTAVDATGAFIFRVRYLPRNCTAKLTAGDSALTVRIDNCEPIEGLSIGPEK